MGRPLCLSYPVCSRLSLRHDSTSGDVGKAFINAGGPVRSQLLRLTCLCLGEGTAEGVGELDQSPCGGWDFALRQRVDELMKLVTGGVVVAIWSPSQASIRWIDGSIAADIGQKRPFLRRMVWAQPSESHLLSRANCRLAVATTAGEHLEDDDRGRHFSIGEDHAPVVDAEAPLLMAPLRSTGRQQLASVKI